MSLAVAKADVLKLMPSDTRVTAFWITHETGSCVSLEPQKRDPWTLV